MRKTIIFNYLDEERKILSLAISEVVFSVSISAIGFILHELIIAFSGMFFGVFMMRYMKAKIKKTGFLRKVFFIMSDLFGRREVKYYGKYYL
jgi:hypothetical protein